MKATALIVVALGALVAGDLDSEAEQSHRANQGQKYRKVNLFQYGRGKTPIRQPPPFGPRPPFGFHHPPPPFAGPPRIFTDHFGGFHGRHSFGQHRTFSPHGDVGPFSGGLYPHPGFIWRYFQNRAQADQFFMNARNNLFPGDYPVNCTRFSQFLENVPKASNSQSQARVDKLTLKMIGKMCAQKDLVTCTKWTDYTDCTNKCEGVQAKSRTCTCNVCDQSFTLPKLSHHGGTCREESEWDETEQQEVDGELAIDDAVFGDDVSAGQTHSWMKEKLAIKEKTCGVMIRKCGNDCIPQKKKPVKT